MSNFDHTHDRLISMGEAAEMLGVETDTIRRLIARGTLPGYRITQRMIRVRVSELEEYVTRRRVPTTRRRRSA